MSVYTLFQRFSAYFSEQDTDSPSFASEVDLLGESGVSNVLYTKRETVELDDTETRTVSLQNHTTADGLSIIAHVHGEATVTTTALDTDDSTAISMAMNGFGTIHHPGIIMLSTYNVSAIVITSLADDTKVVLWASTLADDDDARLTSNA